jgi:arabinofuranosyltransferase
LKADPRRTLLLLILGLVLVQASFGICTQDDAYISFRYAQNLIEGHGLVFNPGERVEGYTNFLWTVLFAPIIGAGLDPTLPSLGLGMLSCAALMWSAWEAGGRRWLAPLLILCFPGLALEGVQGLETAFFAFLVCQSLRPGRWWALWAGIAALTRPEGYAVFGLLWLLRPSLRTAVLFGVITAPHLLFRVLYYGDIVPNTFHAKAGDPALLKGSALSRGTRYLAGVVLAAGPLFAGALLAVKRRIPDPGPLRAAAVLSVFFLLYTLLVGGDFKGTGRFVIPILGPLALLAQAALWDPPRLRAGIAALVVLWALPGFQKMHTFASSRGEAMVNIRAAGICLGEWLPPDALVATHAIGLVPYYSGLPTLDMWGLTDATIARADVGGLGRGTPGHERHDYDYVLSREPLVVLPGRQLVSSEPVPLLTPEEFGPEFTARYEPGSVACPDGLYINLWRRKD